MEIIAKQGEDRYLVQTSPTMGRVLYVHGKIMYPAVLIGMITARGYWENYEPKDGELEELLEQVKIAPDDYFGG